MKTLANSIGTYLTGDAIADAVMDYSSALAQDERTEVVDIPFVGREGIIRRVQFLIGWRTEVNSVQEFDQPRELVDPDVSDELHRKANSVRRPSGDTPFTNEDIDQFFEPEVY